MTIDRSALAAVPEPVVARSAAVESGIAASVVYLGSDAALRSLAVDAYWPKWDSPWWHMLLLHELGEARRIPARAVTAMVEAIDRLLHVFPIRPGELPAAADAKRDVSCHCALGCMHQVLTACGVDVSRALPWVEPWFARYQMADGGLTCDEHAYLVTGECPSSMVGTIAPFEAMLPRGGAFVARGAQFLIDRALTRGSASAHNAEEREAARSWTSPCFPRFYFYDVLRGLAALVRWAETTRSPLPRDAVIDAIDALMAQCPGGVVRVGRRAHEGKTTVAGDRAAGLARSAASEFPLLAAVSVVGEPSEALTRQWTETRRGLVRLIDAGLCAGF